MRNLTVALVVVIGVLGGFYGGWKYSQSKGVPSTPAAAVSTLPAAAPSASASAGGGAGGGFAGRGGTAGQVTSVSGNVVTIHNPTTNQDVKVDISTGTVISKTSAGSVADLQPGTNVTVTGQANPDGSVSATAITIVPALPGGGGGGAGGRGRPTPTPGT
ncbi:MAG: DUF5666 domain-containing protein [Chloroflexota bacterium]